MQDDRKEDPSRTNHAGNEPDRTTFVPHIARSIFVNDLNHLFHDGVVLDLGIQGALSRLIKGAPGEMHLWDPFVGDTIDV